MNTADEISKINLNAFSKKAVAKYYAAEALQKAEEAAINAVKEQIRDKKILEIGVGAGKTIRFLKQISSDYTGIDYSQEMVNECRRRFPDVNVICRDARDMSAFNSDEFDFIICAFNGMDYVSHDDRLLILGEVHRVLKKGGYFVFSTHNRTGAAYKIYISPFAPFATHNPLNPITINPIDISFRTASFLRSAINHWKNNKYIIQTDEYSIINDKAHDYSLMTYYIGIEQQKEQLKNIGFMEPARIFNKDGAEITNDCGDTWVYYLARK
jgi:ubiquinone/menaquinone biosynthesis C-methylase UbiE